MSLDADDADDDETASLDEGDTSLGDYDEDAFVERGSVGSAVASGDVRAYLLFTDNGSALLGRREADGQWSQLRCRYSCLAGGLLLVQREAGSGYGSDHGGAGDPAPRSIRSWRV